MRVVHTQKVPLQGRVPAEVAEAVVRLAGSCVPQVTRSQMVCALVEEALIARGELPAGYQSPADGRSRERGPRS